MAEENLARQAELALERQGDHDSLFYEGRWHSAGSLADRAARLATGLTDLGVRPGCTESATLISSNARKHLGANKYPRQITIVPAIPLTSVGKLDRGPLA